MAEEQTPGVKTVGRYQILEELGRGAMAVVYKGKDPVIGRTVALKTLMFRDDNKDMRDLRQSLYRDACAAGTLAHPNIVTIYDVIEEAGMTAVAMEFIEGRTLEAIIREKAPFSLEMALGYFDQIVAGLDYAHTKGIIHRDVKPANIMLTIDGRVKVTDFGVARVTSAGATMTATVVGSPSYMSPEQVRGGKLDGRSDLFSAATVLYEMLTKSRPFPGDDIATTLYRIVHELPTPPAEFNPAIGPELTRVFERAMAKDPNERYATGVELAKAMRQAGGPQSGKSTARVGPVDGTVKLSAAPAPRPAAPAPVPAARAGTAAAAAPAEATAQSGGKTMVMVGAVAAVLVLAAGGYFMYGRGATPTGSGPAQTQSPTLSAQNNTAAPAGATSLPLAPVAPAPAAAAAADPVAANPVPDQPAASPPPAAARQNAPASSRRGGAANAPASGTATGRATRGSQTGRLDAPAVPTGNIAAAGNTAAIETPPPAPVVAVRVNVIFDVLNNAYAGLQISFNGRTIKGEDLPQTVQAPAGTHEVTYRWTSGPLSGSVIKDDVNLRAGGSNRYRIRPNPNDSSITATPLN